MGIDTLLALTLNAVAYVRSRLRLLNHCRPVIVFISSLRFVPSVAFLLFSRFIRVHFLLPLRRVFRVMILLQPAIQCDAGKRQGHVGDHPGRYE